MSNTQALDVSTATKPSVAVTVAHGDGIGPEIMEATLRVLDAADAAIAPEFIEVGQKVYEKGVTAGIEASSWDSLRRTRVFLKAPITTPRGKGYKSLNVTTRKSLGLFANVRTCTSYHPFIRTVHPSMDVVIIRENEEDTYAGIEHRQTQEVTQCLKLITRPGCEKIIRYAFEYAKRNNRKKVTCFVKDNIMKLTDGLFHQVFDEIRAEYPEIESDNWIIDIGAAKLADTPDAFDVIVMPNLYGDICSDIAAQITGSVGLGASANIGAKCALFEAIHGSAPDIAGQNMANPSGLLLASVMMLNHIGQPETAGRVHNAWLKTIEDGIHTGDIFEPGISKTQVGTKEFADAVIERLGDLPETLTPVSYAAGDKPITDVITTTKPQSVKELVGVDIFIDWDEADRSPQVIGDRLKKLAGPDFKLKMITNRGVKVYPDGFPETFCTDHWRCRFVSPDGQSPVTHQQILTLCARVMEGKFDFIKTEHLYTFDGELGYSLGQGE